MFFFFINLIGHLSWQRNIGITRLLTPKKSSREAFLMFDLWMLLFRALVLTSSQQLGCFLHSNYHLVNSHAPAKDISSHIILVQMLICFEWMALVSGWFFPCVWGYFFISAWCSLGETRIIRSFSWELVHIFHIVTDTHHYIAPCYLSQSLFKPVKAKDFLHISSTTASLQKFPLFWHNHEEQSVDVDKCWREWNSKVFSNYICSALLGGIEGAGFVLSAIENVSLFRADGRFNPMSTVKIIKKIVREGNEVIACPVITSAVSWARETIYSTQPRYSGWHG